MSQAGKVALITGGARGIGRSFAESLLAEGATVVICDISQEDGEVTFAELFQQYPAKVKFIPCDVTNESQLEECFRRTKGAYSGIDIVINNAGIADERDDKWLKMVDVNLIAVIRGTKLGFKYMSKENGGRGGTIVNIASITALEPFPAVPVYSATKAAVNQLSRSYGSDLYYHKSGVKVLSMNPGMTETYMSLNIADRVPNNEISDFMRAHFTAFTFQGVNNMGKGLIEVLQKAQNGSLWTIENEEPPKLTILK